MERFFTYAVLDRENEIVRIGKAHTFAKSDRAVISYLRKRYGVESWNSAMISWHRSEASALKNEKIKLAEFADKHDALPFWNRRHGGGGRQIYKKCRNCNNDAVTGNYGYCGVHRR